MTEMDQVSAWRFVNPPKPWAKGMLVNAKGKRFVDEASYGADLGRETMRPGNDGIAWLILNSKLWKEAKRSLKNDNLMSFQKMPAMMTIMFGTKKAPTIGALAQKIGVDVAGLVETLNAYRRAYWGEEADPFEKDSEDMSDLLEGPYYALNMYGVNALNPMPSITVGGLLVDEKSSLVMRDDGSTIPGLYAAGRTAVGLCTYLYLSGLSAGDCIFSGRRAGRHAANPAIDHSVSQPGLSALFSKAQKIAA